MKKSLKINLIILSILFLLCLSCLLFFLSNFNTRNIMNCDTIDTIDTVSSIENRATIPPVVTLPNSYYKLSGISYYYHDDKFVVNLMENGSKYSSYNVKNDEQLASASLCQWLDIRIGGGSNSSDVNDTFNNSKAYANDLTLKVTKTKVTHNNKSYKTFVDSIYKTTTDGSKVKISSGGSLSNDTWQDTFSITESCTITIYAVYDDGALGPVKGMDYYIYYSIIFNINIDKSKPDATPPLLKDYKGVNFINVNGKNYIPDNNLTNYAIPRTVTYDISINNDYYLQNYDNYIYLENYNNINDFTVKYYNPRTKNPSDKSLVFYVDRTAPSLTYEINNSILTLKSSDSETGVGNVSVTSKGISKDYTNINELKVLPNAEYRIKITDKAGNFMETVIVPTESQCSNIRINSLDTSFSKKFAYRTKINNSETQENELVNYFFLPNTIYNITHYDVFGNEISYNLKTPQLRITMLNKGALAEEEITDYITIQDNGFKLNNYYGEEYNTTINGLSPLAITNDKWIYTIDESCYKIQLIDSFGECFELTIECNYINFAKNTIIGEFFEQPNQTNTSFYSFSTRDNAFKFGIKREQNFVVERNDWIAGQPFPGGCPIEIHPDNEPVSGQQYWIYKSMANTSLTQVAYFNRIVLEEAISFYANKDLKSYYYFEKAPAKPYDGENIFSDNEILSEQIIFRPYGDLTFNVAQIDGDDQIIAGTSITLDKNSSLAERTYNRSGRNIVYIIDKYNNRISYKFTIMISSPQLYKSLTNYDDFDKNSYTLMFDNTNFRNPTENAMWFIIDSFDEYSYFSVFNNTAQKQLFFRYDEKKKVFVVSATGNFKYIPQLYNGRKSILQISEGGEYTISTINHCEQRGKINFAFSTVPPKTEMTANANTRQLDIQITKSSESFVRIHDIQIFGISNGALFKLDADDAGHTISLDMFNGKTATFNFYKYQNYKVIISDNFGTSEFTNEEKYIRPCATGKFTLRNVPLKNDYEYFYNNQLNVAFTFDFRINYLKDTRVILEYFEVGASNGVISNIDNSLFGEPLTGLFTQEGKYILRIVDEISGLENIYVIIIDNTAPTFDFEDKVYFNTDIDYNIDKTLNTAEAIVTYEFKNNTYTCSDKILLAEEGKYIITYSDRAGNLTKYTIIIDKTAPNATLVGVENGGYSNLSKKVYLSDIVDNFSKPENIKLTIYYYNVLGQEFILENVDSSKRFTDEGKYIVYLVDEAGNKSVGDIYFIIDTTAPTYKCSVNDLFNTKLTNKDVTFEWDSASIYEAPITCTYIFNGNTYMYKQGTILAENGEYKITITDAANNKIDLRFIIDKIPVEIEIRKENGDLIPNDSIINYPFKLAWKDEATIKLNNNFYSKNTIITEEGEYSIVATDKAGNTSYFKVQISFDIPIIEFWQADKQYANNSTLKNDVIIKLFNFLNCKIFVKMQNSNDYALIKNINEDTFTLNETGQYKISIENAKFSWEYFINIITPIEASLFINNNQVENKIKTNQDIKIMLQNKERFKINVYIDEIDKSDNYTDKELFFSNNGKYRVLIKDFANNEQAYEFEINKNPANLISATGADNSKIDFDKKIINPIITFNFDNKINKMYIIKDNRILHTIEVDTKNEFVFNFAKYNLYGKYRIVFEDEFGNLSEQWLESVKDTKLNAIDITLISFVVIAVVILASAIALTKIRKTQRKVRIINAVKPTAGSNTNKQLSNNELNSEELNSIEISNDNELSIEELNSLEDM